MFYIRIDNFVIILIIDFMYDSINDSTLEAWVGTLSRGESLGREDYLRLLSLSDHDQLAWLMGQARAVADREFGRGVYIRGLIEISNHCKNGCYYCGIRNANACVERYRLSSEEIMACCRQGYELGFRTFVLQGGEDPFQDDDWLCEVIARIKEEYSDCALTLSVGERSEQVYERFRRAGADRYLLRHETANAVHYSMLHPESMSFENRMLCLRTLKALGFQTGAGMMVGSPGQTLECLVDDLLFLEALQPQMIGMGPFIPALHTPFAKEPAGSVPLTLLLLSVLRLRFPRVLLPATTALSTLDPQGQEKGLLAGANVIMPNLSPLTVRRKYALYADKKYMGNEAAEQIGRLDEKLKKIGFHISYERGDFKP